MQQVSDIVGGDLIERHDAVGRNREALIRKIDQLQGAQNASRDKIRCLEYQLFCANKGAQRLAQKIRACVMDL